jgi:hypothetical protein
VEGGGDLWPPEPGMLTRAEGMKRIRKGDGDERSIVWAHRTCVVTGRRRLRALLASGLTESFSIKKLCHPIGYTSPK